MSARLLPGWALVEGELRPGQALVVQGDRFTYVGPAAQAPAVEPTQQMSRRVVLAGFVDIGPVRLPPDDPLEALLGCAERLLRGTTTAAVLVTTPSLLEAAAAAGLRLLPRPDRPKGGLAAGEDPDLLLAVRALGRRVEPAAALAAATSEGADALGLPTGRLAAGQLADLITFDLDDLSTRPHDRLLENLMRRVSPAALRDVMVGGEWVVQNAIPLRVAVRKLLRPYRPGG